MRKDVGFGQTKKHVNFWELKYLHCLGKKQNTWQTISPCLRNVLVSHEIFPKCEYLHIFSCAVLQNTISTLNMFCPRRVRNSSVRNSSSLPLPPPNPPQGIIWYWVQEVRERRLSGDYIPKGVMYRNSYAKGYRGWTANVNVSIRLYNRSILLIVCNFM